MQLWLPLYACLDSQRQHNQHPANVHNNIDCCIYWPNIPGNQCQVWPGSSHRIFVNEWGHYCFEVRLVVPVVGHCCYNSRKDRRHHFPAADPWLSECQALFSVVRRCHYRYDKRNNDCVDTGTMFTCRETLGRRIIRELQWTHIE